MKDSYDVMLHIPSLKAGGAERVAVEIGRYFADEGYATAFFIHDPDIAFDLPQGVDLILARHRGHVQRVAELHGLLHELRVKAVLSFLPYANLISLLAMIGLPIKPRLVVSEHQSYSSVTRTSLREQLKFALLGRLYGRSHAIVAVSKGVADELRARLADEVKGKVVVIYNPCFIPNAWVARQNRASSEKTVLAVGRLVPQKAFDILIDAFREVKRRVGNVRLIIAGEGVERPRLESLVRRLELQDSVSMPGFSRDVTRVYSQADVFVCSSRTEGFGNVIVEALSFGLPVVSTACRCGPAEILEDGRYGALVPVNDPQALANAIVEMLATPVDPQRQIARAADFSLRIIGAQYAATLGVAR